MLALGIYLAAGPKPEAPIAMVAVMSDEQSRPAMVVSWPPQKAIRDPHIRVRIIQDQPTMAANTSWELWMLQGGKAAQVLRLNPAHAKMIGQAWGVALSVEPKGGSPTGAPTGPVIFKGQCVKVM